MAYPIKKHLCVCNLQLHYVRMYRVNWIIAWRLSSGSTGKPLFHILCSVFSRMSWKHHGCRLITYCPYCGRTMDPAVRLSSKGFECPSCHRHFYTGSEHYIRNRYHWNPETISFAEKNSVLGAVIIGEAAGCNSFRKGLRQYVLGGRDMPTHYIKKQYAVYPA